MGISMTKGTSIASSDSWTEPRATWQMVTSNSRGRVGAEQIADFWEQEAMRIQMQINEEDDAQR